MEFALKLLSEFLGTAILILLGNGVGYSVSGSKMFANQPGKWVVIAFGWGFAVMFGVLVSIALGGSGHLNPAVSVYAAINSLDANLLAYIPFQILGAIFGQIVLNFINWKHIKDTDLNTVRACHCTSPAYNNFKDKALVQNLSYEFVGTLVLIGLIAVFSSSKVAESIGALSVLPVTLLVVSIGMSLGSSTGYAINPARDLGPRIVYFFTEIISMKKRKNELIGAYWSYSWVPVISPLLAGALVGVIDHFVNL